MDAPSTTGVCLPTTLPCGAIGSAPAQTKGEPISRAAKDEIIAASVDIIISGILNSEYYASDYATKDQPHAANLLQTLHDSLIRHEGYAAEREAAGKSNEELDRAKRLLQSLVSATNRRVHIGLPTVYAYLLGKPNHYCSHQFEHWSFRQMLTMFVQELNNCWVKQEETPHTRKEGADLPHVGATTATGKAYDYDFRPAVIASFPLYFFIAGTKSVPTFHSKTWDWKAHPSGAEHPWFRGRRDPRLFVRSAKILVPGTGEKRQLESEGVKLTVADHYREIRLGEPWRVPLLFGKFPTAPDAESSVLEEGHYAMFAMMLLRPWRTAKDALAEWIGASAHFRGRAEGGIWQSLYDCYTTWKERPENRVAPFYSMDAAVLEKKRSA
jgi:hypothetical protein